MPQPTLDDQGDTYRCGVFSVKQWFEGYGYSVDATNTYAKYVALADQQQGLSFNQVHDEVTELATELKVSLQWLGDGYLKDFNTFDQAVKDGWCVDIGVFEGDIKPGQSYYHYIDIYGISGTNFLIRDSFHKYDGEQGQEPISTVHTAIGDNWDAVLVGVAFKISPAGVVLTTNDQLVTMLSVIGDKTYLNPPDLQGIQVLVQQAKHLLGA